MSKLFFILTILFLNPLIALEVTVPVNNWLNKIPETYTMHTDSYINLDSESKSVLSDVLDKKSSFNAVRSGPEGQQTSLFTRGTNSNHTLITINGSAITDHSTTNGLSDLGVIDTSYATQLHLIDGPMSTLYGANAVGGVIDIQTEKKIKNKIISTIGSYGEKKLSIQKNFGENKQYSLGLFLDQTNGISVYPEGDEQDGYNLKGINLGYNGFYNKTEYDLLFIGSSQESDLDASGADDLDYIGKTNFNFFQFNSNTYLSNGIINLIIDSNNWDREYINGSEIDNYYSQTFHVKPVYIFRNKKINNALGYDHLIYRADFDNRGSYTSSVDKDSEQFGIFNNTDFKLNDKFTISAGYRIDQNSHFGNQNTYRLGSAYRHNKFNFFNSFSTGYKNPTLYEMHGADNYGYQGNPNLEPEIAYNSEIGLSFKNKKINTELSIYYTKIKDMITYSNNTYSNDFGGSSKMQGVNLDLNFTINNLNFINSYAHVHAINSSGTWLKRRPHDILSSAIIYQRNIWSLGTEMSYYGKHSDTHSSNYSTIHVKERTLFNLVYTYQDFSFEIDNIFNDTFERPHGYNQGGRNLILTYRLNF